MRHLSERSGTDLPSPKIIIQALAEVKPSVVVAVPLVIEKIYKSKAELINAFGGKKRGGEQGSS